MHLKKLWLTTTALAALAGAQQAQADGMYISVFGGANFIPDQSAGATTFYGYYSGFNEYDADTGFVIGGAIGTGLDNWLQGLRVELEASYRRNDIGGRFVDGGFGTPYTTGAIDGNLSTFAIMANAAYDIDMGWKIKPYVMGGAGWARSKIEIAEVSTFGSINGSDSAENSGFAWQLGAGFNYEVATGVNVGLGYRYFEGPRASYFAGKNIGGSDRLENENHSVMVNLTIDTN